LALSRFAQLKLDLNASFWETIFPYAQAIIQDGNRDTIESVVLVMYYLSIRLIQDEKLWKMAVEEKLLKDNLIHYVPLKLLPVLFFTLANNEKGTPEAFERIEKEIIRNIKFYEKLSNDIDVILLKQGYDFCKRVIPKEIGELLKLKYRDPVPLPDF
jgi:hypothetical protein